MAAESNNLHLDVSLEKARALHRVWRALNDGDCPNCHNYRPAHFMIREMYNVFDDAKTPIKGIQCPDCKFYVLDSEIVEIEKLFAPATEAAVEIFEQWRESKRLKNTETLLGLPVVGVENSVLVGQAGHIELANFNKPEFGEIYRHRESQHKIVVLDRELARQVVHPVWEKIGAASDAVRVCSKCFQVATQHGVVNGKLSSKYCGDGSNKDHEHTWVEVKP